MNGPFNSVADVRRYFDELDHPNCPVAIRTRELREEREQKERKEREARAQQRQGVIISQEWWAAIDQRIQQHLLQGFSAGEEGWLRESIGGALGTIDGRLHREIQDAVATLQEKLDATASKLRDEINTKLAHLPLEVRTWEPIGEEFEKFRHEAHEETRSELQAAVTALREGFDVAVNKLHTEMNARLARLPLVKVWEDKVHYMGDVVVDGDGGGVYQARCDTGRPVTSDDWICLARHGIDGCDGRSPRLRGAFNAHERYRQFDIVTCYDNAYIACRDDPGLPGHDDSAWQLLAKGSRGPAGETGPQGQRGTRGPRGEAAPTIVSWVLDRKSYTAYPTMSDGRGGAPLELRGLFEQFLYETNGWS